MFSYLTCYIHERGPVGIPWGMLSIGGGSIGSPRSLLNLCLQYTGIPIGSHCSFVFWFIWTSILQNCDCLLCVFLICWSLLVMSSNQCCCSFLKGKAHGSFPHVRLSYLLWFLQNLGPKTGNTREYPKHSPTVSLFSAKGFLSKDLWTRANGRPCR